MKFADQLREAMGDMSQAALADATGIRQGTISRYLNDERLPQLPQMDALEAALPTLRSIRDRDRAEVARAS